MLETFTLSFSFPRSHGVQQEQKLNPSNLPVPLSYVEKFALEGNISTYLWFKR